MATFATACNFLFKAGDFGAGGIREALPGIFCFAGFERLLNRPTRVQLRQLGLTFLNSLI